jgi:hypothetical protein
MSAAHAHSPQRGTKLARAILTRSQTARERCEAAVALARWSASSGSEGVERRRSVCRAFRAAKSNVLAVHGVSQLSRAEAREFMKTYFAEGGDMKAVAEWLRSAGAAMSERELSAVRNGAKRPRVRRSARTRSLKWGLGDIVDAVGDAAGAAAGAIGDAVDTVVDAIVSAGKSVGEAVAAAAGWTVGQVTGLVKALIKAGRSVGEILNEALKKNVIEKFVQALIAAGRAAREALEWAVGKAASAVEACLRGLLKAGKTVLDLVSWIASRATDVGMRFIHALVQIGRSVAEMMAAATRLAAAFMRRVIGMIYRAVGRLGEILVSVARSAVSIIRTVIEGLFMIGVSLVQMVASICMDVVQGFRRGFIEGLVALGHAALDVLKAAAVTSLSVLALAVAVFMEIWGGHRPLTAAERAEARRIFGWSINLDRVKVAVASIPADIANWLNGERAFTTMYVINFASWTHITMQTLIHELTHVWQGVVSGPIYMVEALHSQFFGRGYDVSAEDVANANGNIRNLEREQQAVVVEEYWRMRFGDGLTSLPWIPFDSQGKRDWTVLEALATDVFAPQPRIAPIRVGFPSLPIVRLPRAAKRRRPVLLTENF